MGGGTEIPDGEILYRRITKLHLDKNNRPTSFGFKPRGDEGDEISFFLGPQGRVLEGHDGFGLAALKAGDAVAAGVQLERDEKDPRHVRVLLPRGKKQDRTAKLLSTKAQLLVSPMI